MKEMLGEGKILFREPITKEEVQAAKNDAVVPTYSILPLMKGKGLDHFDKGKKRTGRISMMFPFTTTMEKTLFQFRITKLYHAVKQGYPAEVHVRPRSKEAAWATCQYTMEHQLHLLPDTILKAMPDRTEYVVRPRSDGELLGWVMSGPANAYHGRNGNIDSRFDAMRVRQKGKHSPPEGVLIGEVGEYNRSGKYTKMESPKIESPKMESWKGTSGHAVSKAENQKWIKTMNLPDAGRRGNFKDMRKALSEEDNTEASKTRAFGKDEDFHNFSRKTSRDGYSDQDDRKGFKAQAAYRGFRGKSTEDSEDQGWKSAPAYADMKKGPRESAMAYHGIRRESTEDSSHQGSWKSASTYGDMKKGARESAMKTGPAKSLPWMVRGKQTSRPKN